MASTTVFHERQSTAVDRARCRSLVLNSVSSGTVFVNPSVFEGFGLTVLETMAAGTPVVANDLERCKEYARNKVNCLLAARYDFERFLQNVKSLILDPDIARGVSEIGIETAREFSWKKMIEKVRSIYLSMAS